MKKAVFIVLAVMLFAFGILSNAMAVDGLAPVYIDTPVVNPGGLGDGLIYGYYNVRGNLNLFNLVNTDSVDGVKVRMVFRAGKTSEEILDFAVCLSRNDVWTAYLLDNGTTAAICPFDTDTITAPTIPSTCQPFSTAGSKLGLLTADDLREGYFEALGFSAIPNYDKNAGKGDCTPDGGAANCITTDVQCANWCSVNDTSNCWYAPYNTLMGNNAIISFANLETYALNATALAGAFPDGIVDPGPTNEVQMKDGTDCDRLEWALSKTDIIAPYDLLSMIGGETSVIVNFPTRFECHGFVDIGSYNIFGCTTYDESTLQCTKYKTTVNPKVVDDKEHVAQELGFSPAGGAFLPNEVNVVQLNGSVNFPGSTLAQTLTVNGQLGWIDLNLQSVATGNNAIDGQGYDGLATIAYTAQSYVGGASSYLLPAQYMTGDGFDVVDFPWNWTAAAAGTQK